MRTVHAETTWETSNTTKDRFKSLCKMMRNIVFKDLNHRDPTGLFVRDLCFTAESHNIVVLHHG
jgi:hypothetical protein